jgi:hypothetical protein
MKYLRKYNESSKGANDYKFRRDILPSEIEDILLPLKDELIHYKVTFPTSDMRKVEIDLAADQIITNITKENIKPIIHHLVQYLNSEGFELSYYWTSVEGSTDITTPEFNFDEFFGLLPIDFPDIYLAFTI